MASMSSVSAFGFSMKKSKVMDYVSSDCGKNLHDDDKDDGSDSQRAGTPPKLMKKNSLSREDLSSTSREHRNSRNMAKANTLAVEDLQLVSNALNQHNSITTALAPSPNENDNLKTINVNYEFSDSNTFDAGQNTNKSRNKQKRVKTELII